MAMYVAWMPGSIWIEVKSIWALPLIYAAMPNAKQANFLSPICYV